MSLGAVTAAARPSNNRALSRSRLRPTHIALPDNAFLGRSLFQNERLGLQPNAKAQLNVGLNGLSQLP